MDVPVADQVLRFANRSGKSAWAAGEFAVRLSLSVLLALLAVPGLAGLSMAASRPCGPALPHDHILLGGATGDDLRDHLQSEVDCSFHLPSADTIGRQHGAAHTAVVSIARAAPRSVSGAVGIQYRLSGFQALPLPISPQLSGWWAQQSLITVSSRSPSPFEPPPRAS